MLFWRNAMILKKFHQEWLFSTLSKFFQKDQYLRHLDRDLIIQEIKFKIQQASTLEMLLKDLDKEYDSSFEFFRKEGRSFKYPSVRLQVETLFKCWNEILILKKELNQQQIKLTGKLPSSTNMETDGLNDELDIDEVPYQLRNCFGHKVNLISMPKLFGKHTLKTHVLSKSSYLTTNFTKEYSRFKKRIESYTSEKLKVSDIVIIQTDIESFYHCINTDDVIKILETRNNEKSSNIRESIKKIQEELSTRELPIGWILSGPICDLLLNIVHHELMKEKSDSLFLSYVDDFVIITPDQAKDQTENIASSRISLLEKTFNKLLQDSKINFYKEGEKVKKLHLRKGTPGIVDLNYFNIGNLSGEPEDDFKWSSVNEFLLGADNDITLNERVQFLENLKKVKNRILNDEIKTKEQFEDYVNKIVYKISTSGIKYVGNVTELVLTFTISNGIDEMSTIGYLEKITSQMEESIMPANVWLSFFSTIKRTTSKPSLISWLGFKSLKVISEYNESNLSNDAELIHAWAISSLYTQKDSLNFSLLENSFHAPKTFFLKEVVSSLFLNSEAVNDRTQSVNIDNEYLIANYIKYSALRNSDDLVSEIVLILSRTSEKTNLRYIDNCLHQVSDFLREEDFLEIAAYLDTTTITETHQESTLYNLIKSFEYATQLIYFDNAKTKTDKLNLAIKSIKLKSNIGSHDFLEPIWSRDTLSGRSEMAIILLHLSPDIDFWKKIFLLNSSYFDFSNYLSYNLHPTYFPEYLHSIMPKLVEFQNIKLSSISRTSSRTKRLHEILNFPYPSTLDNNIIDAPLKGLIRDSAPKEEISVTIASTDFDIDKDWESQADFSHSEETKILLKKKINQALTQAIKTKSNILIFPELCIPRQELIPLLRKTAIHNIVLIAGIERRVDSLNYYKNTTIISFPVEIRNGFRNNCLAFSQDKNYPAAIEEFYLNRRGYTYIGGRSVYLFTHPSLGSFSVLTCSDFFTTKYKHLLKNKIQSLFVPANNRDNNTFNILSEYFSRELYCFCIVCNNAMKGISNVIAPFNDSFARIRYALQGISSPSFGTISYNIEELKKMQKLTPYKFTEIRETQGHPLSELCKKFKQLPPDWEDY